MFETFMHRMDDIVARIDQRSVFMPSGCIEWQRSKRKGYGWMAVKEGKFAVHRFTCWLEYGEPPEGKPYALHRCDNRACVRPDHLYWGDDRDNHLDRVAAGTARGGRYLATECVNGHQFTEENTYWEPRGWGRACKECRRQAVQRFRARRSVAA